MAQQERKSPAREIKNKEGDSIGIIAYDVEKAKEEFEKGRDPLDISIEKWKDIEKILKLLKREMTDTCGLCFKYDSTDCVGCALFTGRDKSCIDKQVDSIGRAVVYAGAMVRKLKSLRK